MLCYKICYTITLHFSEVSMRKNHHHSKCIKEALKRAETVCAERDIRLTPIRKRVLELVWQSHQPVKAYDLLAQLSTDGHVEKPPTVYRALQFLQENNLIHRIESSNGYIGCEYEHKEMDSKFFVCDQCHEVEELHETKLDKTLNEMSKKQGFIPNQTNIEIHGTCANCAKLH